MRFFHISRNLAISSRLGCRNLVTSCRAVGVPRFGGPDVLEIRDHVEVPNLKPNEVLVKARAVSVNPLDLRMRAGYGRSVFEPFLPFILGRDISREVVAVGDLVRSLHVGQEVFGALHPTARRGTCTDYAVLSDEQVTRKSASTSHVDACAIPFAALTAWRALKSTARITPGQRVLVIGGGGAVGFSAIQLSVAAGCHVSTTCEQESIDRVLAAGAEQAVDYATEDFELAIKGQFDAVGHYRPARHGKDRHKFTQAWWPLHDSAGLLLKKQIQNHLSHGIALLVDIHEI